MNKICKSVERKFPCRNEILKKFSELICDPEEAYPSAIYLYGHSGTGKTAILKEYMRQMKRRYRDRFRAVHVNCIECYTTRILLESVLEELLEVGTSTATATVGRIDHLKDFIGQLRHLSQGALQAVSGLVIVIDNAERLRDMDANVLPTLLRLQQLSGLNVSVVLLSQLPFEKYHCKGGLTELLTLHFPQYTKTETLRILSADFEQARCLVRARLKITKGRSDADEAESRRQLKIVDTITPDFFSNYLNVFLSFFYKACRDVPELKVTSRRCFAVYLEPVLAGEVDASDVSRLWRHIAEPLKRALALVYMRTDLPPPLNQTVSTADENTGMMDQSARKMALSLELPYYGKYLLIAAFLASYNSAKQDRRLFVKHHGKQRKRMQAVNAKAKVTEKMSTSLGPKSFGIDRLLAIFYAILEEKVGLTCNLLSQISTLVHLKLLSFVSGESNIMDGSARLQCTVGLDFVLQIGKVVGFNVRQYLCDFM